MLLSGLVEMCFNASVALCLLMEPTYQQVVFLNMCSVCVCACGCGCDTVSVGVGVYMCVRCLRSCAV